MRRLPRRDIGPLSSRGAIAWRAAMCAKHYQAKGISKGKRFSCGTENKIVMTKTVAQFQRSVDEVLSGLKCPRYIVKIISGRLPAFFDKLRKSRRTTYLGSMDCDGDRCLEIGLDEGVTHPQVFLQGLANRANCAIEVGVD
jgi:hypothetical protein